MTLKFSAEHIRQQPEYQFITAEKKKPGKASINLNDLSLRIIELPKPAERTRDSRNSSPTSSTPRCNQVILKSHTPTPRPIASVSRTSSRQSNSNMLSWYFPPREHKSPQSRPKTVAFINPQSGGEFSDNVRGIQSADINRQVWRRQSSSYDPNLEKTHQFLKSHGSSFSQTSQVLTPLKRGLRRVEVHYSDTNVNQNDSRIFSDLIKNSHRTNIIFQERVDSLERRLLVKRNDLNKATTFYDTVLRRPSLTITPRSARNRTVAGKQDERKKRIKKKNNRIKLGDEYFEPRAWSIHSPTEEDLHTVLDCRYLRVNPKYQPQLYDSIGELEF